jgi:hypothetical protein
MFLSARHCWNGSTRSLATSDASGQSNYFARSGLRLQPSKSAENTPLTNARYPQLIRIDP